MLEDFQLEISQRLICLVGGMGTRVVVQEQHAFGEESWSLPLNGLTKFPDLAPSDFHLFGPLKYHISAEHFPDDEAVETDSSPKNFMLLVFRGL
jgi:hypothetical protein